jgi:hypothetical protein
MKQNNDQIVTDPPANVLSFEPVQSTTPLFGGLKPVTVNDAKSARRLFSRLISGFQKGEIEGQAAKTLSYLLVSFLQACSDAEIERRMDALEKKKGGAA